ncbi:MAG: sigma 54-interacting transcriptional regulator [Burkholderiales bacterium]|nr:sigma 54-interacting transcriptional regulator [Burkholderiales bacterium]
MTQHYAQTLLSLPTASVQPLSIRAKALVFNDPASRKVLDTLERIGPSEAPVLIIGETGTGKELVARHVHSLSRRKGPFVAVNCGAISEQLAESELFGHEAGAFTGATGRREGWFEAADNGTLFLDEIGDLPLPLQVKLLRVLQEREVVRIGSRKAVPVNVRLVAATNVDLAQAVSAGHFRLDLLYRLNIAQVKLPPLRERPGDVMPLAEYFLDMYANKLGTSLPAVADTAREALLAYPWPGNIRELENVIHFAVLVSSGETIRPEHLKFSGGFSLPNQIRADNSSPIDVIAEQLDRLFGLPDSQVFEQVEKLLVVRAFLRSRENQVRAAELLGVTRNVYRTLMKRYGLLGEQAGDLDGLVGQDWEQDAGRYSRSPLSGPL